MNPVDLSNGSGVPLNIPMPTQKTRSDPSIQNAQRSMMMNEEEEDSTPIEMVPHPAPTSHLGGGVREYAEVVITYPGGLSENKFEFLLLALLVAGAFSPQLQSKIAAHVPAFSSLGGQSTFGLFATAALTATGFLVIRSHFQK